MTEKAEIYQRLAFNKHICFRQNNTFLTTMAQKRYMWTDLVQNSFHVHAFLWDKVCIQGKRYESVQYPK